MTVRDAFKDELAMLDELAGCSTPTEQWLEEALTDVNPDVGFDGGIHDLNHAVLRRIVRETLMRIYGSLLWVSTNLKVLEDPKPHYLLGVIAIEKDLGICITWDRRTKTPYLYRDLYSVDDLVQLLEEVDLRAGGILGDEVRFDYSDAVTSANLTLKEIVRTYRVTVAADADVWDVLEYLCDHYDLCPTLKEIAKLVRETFPDATITLSVCHDPEIDDEYVDEYLKVEVKPSAPDPTLNDKLDRILNVIAGKLRNSSGWVQIDLLNP
jgi:hypothetical protein